MSVEEAYRAAMERFFAVRPRRLREHESDSYSPRGALHDRERQCGHEESALGRGGDAEAR